MNYLELYNRNYNKNVKNFIAIVYNLKCQVISAENFNIFSIKQIIDELILECNSNRLTIKRNIKFFNCIIKNLKEKDYLISRNYVGDINLLLGKLNEKKPNADLIIAMCMQLKDKLCKKDYFNFLVDSLNNYIKDDMQNNYQIIKEITENIFMLLMYKGYDFKEIFDMILNLFSLSEIDKNRKLPITTFPMNLIKKKFQITDLNTYINEMPINERIEYIKEMYMDEENTYYVIMLVDGIMIDEKDLKCSDDIIFYNPNISDPLNLEDKTKWRDDKFKYVDYTKSCNVCITVQAYNTKDAYNKGIKKLDNYINILKVISILDNYKINERNCVILDDKTQIARVSYHSYKDDFEKRKFEREIRAIDENDVFYDCKIKDLSIKLENLICSDEGQKNKLDKLLLNSISKYSDAIDSTNNQEAILKYWSALESLFDENLKLSESDKKIDYLLEIIPIYLVYILKYQPLHNLYHELKIATDKYFIDSDKDIIELSDELLNKLDFNKKNKTHKSVSLDILIDHNDEIFNSVDDYYYQHQLKNIKLLYTDSVAAFKKLNSDREKYENDIIMIYRIRNQIIHDACCNDISIKFYLPLLKKIVNSFLNTIIEEYVNNKNKTINEIIYNIYSKSILFINNSKESTLQSLLY